MSNAASPSYHEWKARIEPLLGASLREASERITSHPSIQAWLHEASFEAIQRLEDVADLQAEAQAHAHMVERMEQHFTPLVDAVRDMTSHCGHLDLHWRPLEPNYSRIYIDFGRDFAVDVFYLLDTLTAREARQALQTVKAALPEGVPFQNRPNEATGIAAYGNRCVGLRYRDRIDDHGRRWRRVMLLPKQREPIRNLREEAAIQALLDLFDATTRPNSPGEAAGR